MKRGAYNWEPRNVRLLKMSVIVEKVNGIDSATEPTSLLSETDSCTRLDVAGSVMDGMTEEVDCVKYSVYKSRWVMLVLFVIYSASNSLQWTQYTIIQDIVVKYYDVPSTVVSWTSMVYMITYVPLIFPASWLLDKTVSFFYYFFNCKNF